MSKQNPTQPQCWVRNRFVIRGQLELIAGLCNYLLTHHANMFPYIMPILRHIKYEARKAKEAIEEPRNYNQHLEKREDFYDNQS